MDLIHQEKKQSRYNVGFIGHVANGKSTLAYKITGTKTQRDSREVKKAGKTLNLSYADGVIYQCVKCPAPKKYQSYSNYNPEIKCINCGGDIEFVRHLSIVDCPGHHQLITKMMDGSSVMHGVVVVESVSNADLPSPQTIEHLMAASVVDIPVLMVILNKVDTVSEKLLMKKMEQIKGFFPDIPVVPISANHGHNVDVVLEYLSKAKLPDLKMEDTALMYIIRTFGTNTPGTDIKKLKGAVVGGSIIKGVLKIGDEVIFYPGLIELNKKKDETDNKWLYLPLKSKVESIFSEKTPLDIGLSGGLIGVQTGLDPSLSTKNRMVGNILLSKQTKIFPEVFEQITIEYKQTKYVPKDINLDDYQINEKDVLFINCNSANVEGRVKSVTITKSLIEINLISAPLCCFVGQKIPISKYVGGDSKRLVGYGEIISGRQSIMKIHD
jgi:translation initiation factor 2 subunit 3